MALDTTRLNGHSICAPADNWWSVLAYSGRIESCESHETGAIRAPVFCWVPEGSQDRWISDSRRGQKEWTFLCCSFVSLGRITVLGVATGVGIIPITAYGFRSGASRTFASGTVARFSKGYRPRLRKVGLVFYCEARQIGDKLLDARLTLSFYVGLRWSMTVGSVVGDMNPPQSIGVFL